MTLLETEFLYGRPPNECEAQALNDIRDVYGIRNVILNQKSRSIGIEYDASRLTESDISDLLRAAGIQILETSRSG